MNKQFDEWLIKSDYREIIADLCCLAIGQSITKAFYRLPFSMQWGVYLEFFDSVGIVIDIDPQRDSFEWFIWLKDEPIRFEQLKINTRPEAQQEAIKKAFEILEAQLKDNG